MDDLRFVIEINMSGAAFADGAADAEIARILRGLAFRLCLSDGAPFVLHDANGNRCGIAEFRGERD